MKLAVVLLPLSLVATAFAADVSTTFPPSPNRMQIARTPIAEKQWSRAITELTRAVCEDSRNADAHHQLASSTSKFLGGLAVSNNLKQQQRCVDISNKTHDVVPLRLIL